MASTVLGDDRKSGGNYILECSILNAYVLHSFVHTAKKTDYLHFRLQLAEVLIGSFRSRRHAGLRRSEEHAREEQLNNALGHWPESVR